MASDFPSYKNDLFVEPYDKIGPYGEVLWFLLTTFKLNLVRGIIAIWKEKLSNESLVVEAISNVIYQRLNWGIELHRTNKDEYVDSLAEELSDLDTSPKSLAEERWSQLEIYLTKQINLIDEIKGRSANPDDVLEVTRSRLALLIGNILWPYYFIEDVYYEHSKRIITWMPNIKLLRHESSGATNSGVSSTYTGTGLLLYPSIDGLLRGAHRTKTNERVIKLYEILKRSLSKGFTRDDDSYGEKQANIGYVQPMPTGANSIYFPNLFDRALKSSRFSDFFYLNRSGYRYFEYHKKEKRLVGVLHICSPLNGILLDLTSPEHPENIKFASYKYDLPYNSKNPLSGKVGKLQKIVEDAWAKSNGAHIGTILRQRYTYTCKELLNKKDELASKAIADSFSFMKHDLLNLFMSLGGDDISSVTAKCQIACAQYMVHAVSSYAGSIYSPYYSWGALSKNIKGVTFYLDDIIREAFSTKGVKLEFDFKYLEDHEFDICLVGALIELTRNMVKHISFRSGKGKVSIKSKENKIKINAESSPHLFLNMHKLYNSMSSAYDLKGIVNIARFMIKLRGSNIHSPASTWTFDPIGVENHSREFYKDIVNIANSSRIKIPDYLSKYVIDDSGCSADIRKTKGVVIFESADLYNAVKA